MTNNASESAKNKRREARKRTLTAGRIVSEDGATYIDCTILDISASGAQVRIGHRHAIPARFYLINVRDRTAHAARAMWRDGDRTGLCFDATYALSGAGPEHLGHLRKHWLACATR